LHVKRVCGGAGVVVHVCLSRTLIHFRYGKFLHYPYFLTLGEVMPNFSALCIPLGEDHACVCVHVLWF